MKDPTPDVKTTQWDGFLREGPGAVSAAIPIIEVDGHGGHATEPDYKKMPIGPDHILYPVMISLALFPILMGSAGHHLADDMPEEDTHPFFPDHFWPYPVIIVIMMITVGLFSAFIQQNLQLEQSADPRTVTLPRPDWYFLFLFQFLKLGNEFVMSIVIPGAVATALLLWPFIDNIGGRIAARRLGWASWPVPGRNKFTGTGWIVFLGILLFLTFWSLSGVTLPWFTGPVSGG